MTKKILFFLFFLGLMSSFAYAEQTDQVSNYSQQVNAYFKQGRYKEAIEELQKIIELRPDYSYAYYNLGIAYQNLDQIDKAYENFKKALELDIKAGNQKLIAESTGKIARLNRYQEAINYYKQANIYDKQHKYNEAIRQLRQAIQLEPDFPEFYYHLALCFIKLNKEQGAFENYNKALLLSREHGDQRMSQAVQAHLRALARSNFTRKTGGFTLISFIILALGIFLGLMNKDIYVRYFGAGRYLIAKKYLPPSYICFIIAFAIFYFDPFIYSFELGINVVLFVIFLLVGIFLLAKYQILSNRIAKKGNS